MLKTSRLALSGLLAASVLIAPGCAQEQKMTSNGDTMVFQEQQEPDALNPLISDMLATIDATAPILEGLTNSDDHMRTVPVLAERVPSIENGDVKTDGKTMDITWHLRHGVKWHDGAPFTSQDVKFTWQIVMDKNTKVTSTQGFDKITAIDTPDPYTAVMHFKEVYAPYDLLFGLILPDHLLHKYLNDPDSINKCAYNRHPIGTGPFKFSEWVSGDHITFTAFDQYWRGKPKIKTLKMRIVPDQNAAFTLLKSGELDLYQSAAIAQYDAIRKLPHVTIDAQPALMWELLSFDLKRPILQDVRVRRAIAYAINKKQISEKIYENLYPPAYSDQSPLSWVYNKAVENYYPYSPEKANQLLDEAGWKLGLDGVRTKDGQRLELKLSTTTGNKPRELTELVLKYYLKKIGIDVEFDNQPGEILFGEAPTGTLKGAHYDMAMYAWSAAPDPDVYSLWHSSQMPKDGSQGQNTCFFSDKEMDMLLAAGTKTLKREDRKKIYMREQEVLASQLPVIPLLYWANLNPINTRVKNFKPNPTSAGNIWNCYEWELDDSAPAKATVGHNS